MNRFLPLAFIVAVVCGLASPASAITAIYTDRPSFLAALGGANTIVDPFDNDIAQAQTITFDSGIMSTASSAPIADDNSVANGVYNNAVDGNGSGSAISTLWTFPEPVFAIGFDGFGVNLGALTIRGDFSGTGVEQINLYDAMGNTNGFIGVVGMAPFSTVEFFNLTDGLDIYDVDNVVFAPVASTSNAVPEPATAGLAALSVLALGSVMTRRRRSLA